MLNSKTTIQSVSGQAECSGPGGFRGGPGLVPAGFSRLRRGRRLLALAVTLALAACASPGGLGPNASLHDTAGIGTQLATGAHGAAVEEGWWRGYDDPQLDALVQEALQGSPDLRVAETRIAQARAQAAQAGAALQPSVSATASATRQRYSAYGMVPAPYAGNYANTPEATLDFSFELDFWGRNRARLQAAMSGVEAAQLERSQAELVLAAAVVRTYGELDHHYALRDLAAATVAQRSRIGELTAARQAAGLETRVELRQSESAVFAARTTLAAEDEQIALLRNQLATLVGAGPERGRQLSRPALAPVATLPPEVPADLVGRRPDLQARLARARAAGASVDAAKAAFYPNVNLSAFVGLQAVGFDHFLRSDSRIVGIAPALSLPILDGGRLRAGLAQAYSEQDEAVEQYNGAVLGALQDVADRLVSWQALDRQRAEQQQAQAAAEEAYRLALLRYREGLSNYLTVLSVETQVLEQRRQAVELAARSRDNAIELSRALGGGFSATPAAAQS